MTPSARIVCPLCRKALVAEALLTADLWRWWAMCDGYASDVSQPRQHGVALVEVTTRPSEGEPWRTTLRRAG